MAALYHAAYPFSFSGRFFNAISRTEPELSRTGHCKRHPRGDQLCSSLMTHILATLAPQMHVAVHYDQNDTIATDRSHPGTSLTVTDSFRALKIATWRPLAIRVTFHDPLALSLEDSGLCKISSKLHGGVDEHSEASTRRGTRATSAEVVRSYRAGGRPTCDQERFGKNQL